MSSAVMFGKTIAIDPAKPLPLYDNGSVKAYAAVDNTRSSGKNLIAYICEPALVPRRTILSMYKGLTCPSSLIFVASGICAWPLTGDERYIFVYDHNFFSPLQERNKEIALSWRDNEVVDFYIKPMVAALNELRNRGIFHGAIRPSNIFFSIQGKNSPVILGDCLTGPPSSTQSAVYEPVERAMAHPLARGEGMQVDDMYAFGVTLAVLLRTSDPLAGMTEEEIIKAKLEHGSYHVVAGKDRYSGHILEVLRGTLHDNPAQRWTIDDLLSWVDGRRLSPQQAQRKKKAARAIDFAGEKHYYAYELAYAMQKNPVVALNLIESGEIIEWLQRSVNDSETSERIENYLGRDMAKSKTRGNNAAMVAGVITALELGLPLFYKDKGYFAPGIGSYFAALVKRGEDASDIHEMLLLNIFSTYLFMQPNAQNKFAPLVKSFEGCRLSINQVNAGFGMERCLYTLCPDAQCLSPRFEGYFVTNVEEIMQTFEDLCEKKQMSTSLMLDRHIIAFLSVFEGSLIDGRLYDLNSKNKHQQVLGNLKVLASMQKRTKVSSYPNIARVFAENMKDLYERYHDNELRSKVESDINRAVKAGDIIEILEIIDNPTTKNRDKDDFRRAMREYIALKEEYRQLEEGLRNMAQFGLASGHGTAALISWGLAGIIVLIMIIMHFGGN